jgi:anti-sigma B factor antagonist
MEITIHDSKEVKIVRFDGELETNTSHNAEVSLSKLMDEGVKKILVDFEKLDYISSAGLRVLLATAQKLKAEDGALRVCNLNETVQEVFDISGFSTILSVFKTESEALNEF